MVADSGTDAGPTAEGVAVTPATVAPTRLSFSSWSIVRAILIVLAVMAMISIVIAASTPLWWLAIATAVAGLFLPAVLWLRRFIPGWLAIIAVLLGVSLATGLLGYRGFDELRAQFETLQTNALNASHDLETSKQFGEVATEFNLSEKVAKLFSKVPLLQVGGEDAADAVQTAASSGGALFAIGMLALLLLIFARRMARDAIDQITAPEVADRVRVLVYGSYRASSRYVYLMAVRAVVVGVAGGVACSIGGLGTPTALGLWFAVLSLVPGSGLVVAALPIAMYAAITSLPLAIFVFFLSLLIQLLDAVIVQRRIDAYSVRVGPGATLVAALIGAQLYGIGGALVLLAITVFAMAFLARVTAGDVDIFTAFRTLAARDVAAGEPA
jgi:predicted PurR-regulated permease PerM